MFLNLQKLTFGYTSKFNIFQTPSSLVFYLLQANLKFIVICFFLLIRIDYHKYWLNYMDDYVFAYNPIQLHKVFYFWTNLPIELSFLSKCKIYLQFIFIIICPFAIYRLLFSTFYLAKCLFKVFFFRLFLEIFIFYFCQP